MASRKADTAVLDQAPPDDLDALLGAGSFDPDEEDNEDEGEGEDETEGYTGAEFPATATATETTTAEPGKKTRRKRTPKPPSTYLVSDSSYSWVLTIEAKSVREATEIALNHDSIDIEEGCNLIIAEVVVNSKIKKRLWIE